MFKYFHVLKFHCLHSQQKLGNGRDFLIDMYWSHVVDTKKAKSWVAGCDTEIYAGEGNSLNFGLINYSWAIIAYTLDVHSQFRGDGHGQFWWLTVYTSNNLPTCSAAYSSEFTGPHGY